MGIGDWGLGPIPNPQSPIPNPQYTFLLLINLKIIKLNLINYSNYKLIIYPNCACWIIKKTKEKKNIIKALFSSKKNYNAIMLTELVLLFKIIFNKRLLYILY